MRELAAAKRFEKERKKQEIALKVAEKKNLVYEAGADGFDLSEEPVVEDRDQMTDNSPETRVEVRPSIG